MLFIVDDSCQMCSVEYSQSVANVNYRWSELSLQKIYHHGYNCGTGLAQATWASDLVARPLPINAVPIVCSKSVVPPLISQTSCLLVNISVQTGPPHLVSTGIQTRPFHLVDTGMQTYYVNDDSMM